MAKDRSKNGKKVSNSETPKTDDDFIRIQKKHFYAAICFLIASLLFYQLNQAYSVITKVKLVKEWVAKSSKVFYSCRYLPLIFMVSRYFAKKQRFHTKNLKNLTHKSNKILRKTKSDPNIQFLTHWPSLGGLKEVEIV